MKSFLAFLFLTLLSRVFSQITLVESGPEVVKPSVTLRLACKVTGYNIGSGYDWCWIRQPPGKALEYLAHIYGPDGRTYYNPTLRSRLTISKDNSKNEFYLEMRAMNPGDTATYYCVGRWGIQKPLAFDVWGPGTFLTVSSAEKAAPSVFPMIASNNPSDKAAIGCLIKGYFPKPVDITWNSGSIQENIKHFPAVLGQNGLYTRFSQLAVTASDWKSKSFECNVDHKPTGTKKTKKVAPRSSKLQSPTVKVLQSSQVNGTVVLVCMINNFYPAEIEIQWLKNEDIMSTAPIRSTTSMDSEGLFTTHSQMNIQKNDWKEENLFTCQVQHIATNTKPTDSIKKYTSDPIPTQPEVTLTKPSIKNLYVTFDPQITCTVSNLHTLESLQITWSHNKQNTVGKTTEPKYNYDGTISVSSSLPVSTKEWENRHRIVCTVTHNDLPTPVSKIISNETDVINSVPSVHLLPPSETKVNSKANNAPFLTCMVDNFLEVPPYIQWQKSGTTLSEDTYINTNPTHDKVKNSNFMYSKLEITENDWNNRSMFICKVVYPTLPNKSVQLSIQKPLGKSH